LAENSTSGNTDRKKSAFPPYVTLYDETKVAVRLRLPPDGTISYGIRSDVFKEISGVWCFGNKSDIEWVVVYVFHISSLL